MTPSYLATAIPTKNARTPAAANRRTATRAPKMPYVKNNESMPAACAAVTNAAKIEMQ